MNISNKSAIFKSPDAESVSAQKIANQLTQRFVRDEPVAKPGHQKLQNAALVRHMYLFIYSIHSKCRSVIYGVLVSDVQ